MLRTRGDHRLDAMVRMRIWPAILLLSFLCRPSVLRAQEASTTARSGQETAFKAKPATPPAAKEKGDQSLSGLADAGPDLRPFLGNIYPEDQDALLNFHEAAVDWLGRHRVRSYGWLDGGVTTISHVSGLATEAPTSNRFSNQAMLNGAWIIVERLTTKDFSWGFRADFYGGSDAALLRPQDSFGPASPRWGTDFRQAYLTLHTPVFFKRGVDWYGGRINNPTGFETLMAPYRALPSESYYWIHYEVGSTALEATLHPKDRLDLTVGTVMGYNTQFQLRGRAPSYVARAIYRPRGAKDRQWLVTAYSGPQPVAATAGHAGHWQTLAELQAREVWSPRVAQVVLVHFAVDVADPAAGGHSSSTQGAFAITSFKLSDAAYINTRVEWFSDPHGVRVALPGSYGEAALGMSLHPARWIDLRPEIRGDFSGQHSFGGTDRTDRHRNQFSAAFEMVYKGRLF